MSEFFADSYAILAHLAGDPAYVARFKDATFRTSILNLFEAHYAQISRGVPDAEAVENLAPFEARAEAPDWSALREASLFRHELRSQGRRCSYIDAAGLVLARRSRLPFLTGDPAFEDVAGVEFLVEGETKPAAKRGPRRS